MDDFIKKTLKSIYRHWVIQLPKRGLEILFEICIYQPLHRSYYRQLEKFKDIHKGERCFIVATGPSLTLEDVNKLKGEYTFSVNSIYKLFDKTDWRPTYYGIIDKSVYLRCYDDLKNVELDCAFVPDRRIDWKKYFVHHIPIKANWCCNRSQRDVIPEQWRKKKFSKDMTVHLYEGTSVVHFIMQIAFYMGFSEIYLLGTDCTAPTQHSKFLTYKDSERTGQPDIDIYEGLMKDYQKAKEVASQKGIHIYNATRGGALELFERVDLDAVCSDQRCL